MSQTNLTMKDMFEVQNAKDATQAMGAAKQQELRLHGRGLWKGGREEIEADPVERSAGRLMREDGRGYWTFRC